MIIAVEGTKKFADYDTFMRAMGVAMSQINGDKHVEVWSIGPYKINNFTAAFCNSSENFLRKKGIRISFRKVNAEYVSSNMDQIVYFAYFSARGEKPSSLVASAELNNIEVGIFRV